MGKEGHIPQLSDNSIYSEWKNEVALWEAATSLAVEKQAPNVILAMKGKPRKAALQIPIATLKAADGMKKLLDELDKLYLKDNVQMLFAAIDTFERYRRPKSTSMDEYITEFTRLNGLVTECRGNKAGYEDGILAYRLLQQASLSKEEERLVRATTSELTLVKMTETLKRTFGDGHSSAAISSSSSASSLENSLNGGYSYSSERSNFTSDIVVKQEPTFYQSDQQWVDKDSGDDEEDETLFYNGSYYRKTYKPTHFGSRGSRGSSGSYSQRPRGGSSGYNAYKKPNNFQNFSGEKKDTKKDVRCHKCREWGHIKYDCPQWKTKKDESKMNFFQSDFTFEDNLDSSLTFLMGETVNKALLDTGASSTVCGAKWMKNFEDSLTPDEREQICDVEEKKSFRFGDGKSVASCTKKKIPVTLCGKDILLETHVVENDVPLLLSRVSMKKMGMKIDNQNDKIFAFGGEEDLIITQSGHMVVPIGRCVEKTVTQNISDEVDKSVSYLVDVKDPQKCALHLHRYFAHGPTKKIASFVDTTDLEKKAEIVEALANVSKNCDFCLRHKTKEVPHRKVGIPMGSKFNDVVAIDLKLLGCGLWIIHIIDTTTRFSGASTIKSKDAEEIVSKMFDKWISVFGQPRKYITDNGGEFVNTQFNDLCSVMNINLKTSPSESPWCNGTVERHNGLLAEMIDAVIEETHCKPEIAVAWAVNSKNSLNNTFGFSPYQLVFGKNPEVPNIMSYRNLPALNEETCSRIVAENLNAMESARKSFIQLENSGKIRRALRERVYERANARYFSGDVVYYKRTNNKGPWNGPATVVGHIDNNVLLKHGGSLVRIHPCKIILKQFADDQVNAKQVQTHKRTNVVPERQRPVVDKDKELDTSSDDSSDSDSDDNDDVRRVSVSELDHSVVPGHDQDLDKEPVCFGNKDPVCSGDKDPVPSGEVVCSRENDPNEDSSSDYEDSVESTLWQGVIRQSNKVCLNRNDIVRFKADGSDDWTNGLVKSRAGKVGGKNQNKFNMNIDGEEDVMQIDADQVEIEKLRNTETTPGPVAETLFTQEDEETVLYKTSLPNEDAVAKAKAEELKKFVEYNVYKEVKNMGQSTVSCRWVITKKGDKGPVKARLVARGFEEILNEQVDAPTVSISSMWILFSIVASNSWRVESFDITSAFLQAQDLDREVFVNPPSDARKQGVIWKLKKPMYGLGDSARQWYTTLKSHLIDAGCKMSRLDKSVFRWYDENKKLAGILVTHVDDVLYAGNTKFKTSIIQRLLKTFKISRQDVGCFTYLGLEVDQNNDTKVITVDQEKYAKSIHTIDITPVSRRKDVDSDLTEEEKAKYQSMLGKLLWLSGRTRPDLRYDTMELSTFTKSPKIKDLLFLNKIVKKVKDRPSRLIFKPLNLKTDELKIVFYSDAGFGNLPNANSSRGYVSFLVNQDNTANVLSWSSNKIKRVVHSAFAAETLGCNDAMSDAIYLRQILCEILYDDPKSKIIPIVGFVDNMQLFEQVSSSKQSQDKRVRLDIAEIQESVQSGDIDNIYWIPTQDMLADCLTKRNADSMKLTNVLETGQLEYLNVYQ